MPSLRRCSCLALAAVLTLRPLFDVVLVQCIAGSEHQAIELVGHAPHFAAECCGHDHHRSPACPGEDQGHGHDHGHHEGEAPEGEPCLDRSLVDELASQGGEQSPDLRQALVAGPLPQWSLPAGIDAAPRLASIRLRPRPPPMPPPGLDRLAGIRLLI